MNILVIHEVDWFKKVIFEPHHLAELFSLKGHSVYVIDCPEPDMKNFFNGLQTSVVSNYNRVYKNAHITVIRPPSLRIKGLNRATQFLTCKRSIEKIVKEKKIDIILLYGVATNGIQTMKVAKENNIPVIFRSLDIAHGLIRIPVLKQLAKRYEKIILSNAIKVLATTPHLARYAIELGANKENVETFSLGINLVDFKPMEKDSKLAKSLGISSDDKVVVFMGTIYDFAGLDELVLKFSTLKNKFENIKLLIVGGGPSFETIRSLVKKLGLERDVIMTDFIPQQEIPKYISLSNICVNPFRINYVTERILPTKILEYLACKKAVLSTPLEGTKELLPNEDFGIVYADLDKFTEKLHELLSDDQKLQELGDRGYRFVRQNHDWDILSQMLLDKFEKILHKN